LSQSKTVPSIINEVSEIIQPRDLSYDHALIVEKIFEVDRSLVTSIQYLLPTSEGQEKLHANYDPLVQKYLKTVLSSKKAVNIDVVHGVYFSYEGIMFGDKRITLHNAGTPGLYELIFMKFPNESICTDEDVQTYRSIMLTTNAHRCGHSPSNQVMGSKGYKYKNLIAPSVSDKKIRTGINKRVDLPRTMILNDNKIDSIRTIPTKL